MTNADFNHMMKDTFKREASDPKVGMTLAEMRSFIDQAERLGVSLDTKPKIVVNMKNGIKTLEIRY